MSNRLKVCVVPAIMLCMAFSGFASEGSKVVELVKKNYSGTRMLHVKFDLTTYWSVREREEKISGAIYLSPDEKFRVELGRELFVSDGIDYWQYSKKNNQLIIRTFEEIGTDQLPSTMLSGYLTRHAFVEKGTVSGVTEIHATPEAQSEYTSIKAWVVAATGVVKKLVLTDKNENIITYTFTHTEFGSRIPKEVFKFETPSNVEVLDMRK